MYRHRPSMPSLIGAGLCLVVGILSSVAAGPLERVGDLAQGTQAAVIGLTVITTGLLLIAAFARYQFTHLWIDPRKKKPRRPSSM